MSTKEHRKQSSALKNAIRPLTAAVLMAAAGLGVSYANAAQKQDDLTRSLRSDSVPAAVSASITAVELPPAITQQPQSANIPYGNTINLLVGAVGTGPLSYQWQDDGVDITGNPSATTDNLVIPTALPANSGRYDCVVSNAEGSVTSLAASVVVNPMTTGNNAQLINISTRSFVGTGGNIQIAGFVIARPTKVLIRADGPALTGFGVSGVLPDPTLTLLAGQNILASNTAWGTASNAGAIQSAATQVGAFPLAQGSKDSAILTTLQPGAYTAEVYGASGDTGVALVEVYDCDDTTHPELINISTRSVVETGGNIQIAGFVIIDQPATVLIRADGPALTGFGVSGVLPDPTLTLYSGQNIIASNTAWGTAVNAGEIQLIAAQVGAFTITPGSDDSAILITLPPGAYTAEVKGASGDTGVALVEVYYVTTQ